MFPRRAFTFGPVPVLLALALLALLTWRMVIQISAAGQASFVPRGYTQGVVVANVTIALVCLALAGGLGALSYFVSRKSETVANFAMTAVLILPVALFGYQGVNYLRTSRSRPAAIAPISPGQPNTLTPSPSPAPRNTVQPQPAAPRAARTAPPVVPDAAPSPPTPSLPTAPPPALPLPEADPKVKAALDAITAELASEVSAMWPDVDAAFTDWAKAPRHDMRVLDSRRAAAADLKAVADRLGKRFRDVSREAQNRLVEAGVERSIAQGEAGRFASDYCGIWRATACDTIERAAGRVIDECEYLKKDFSKWNLDAKGDLTSKDFAFKGRANGLRSVAEFSVRDKDDVRKTLDEGR